jgi:hypothetical protein
MPFLTHWSWLRFVPFTWTGMRAHGGCDRSTGDAYSSMAPDPTSDIFRGPFTPILWFVFPIRLMRLNTDRYFCHFIQKHTSHLQEIVRALMPFISIDIKLVKCKGDICCGVSSCENPGVVDVVWVVFRITRRRESPCYPRDVLYHQLSLNFNMNTNKFYFSILQYIFLFICNNDCIIEERKNSPTLIQTKQLQTMNHIPISTKKSYDHVSSINLNIILVSGLDIIKCYLSIGVRIP